MAFLPAAQAIFGHVGANIVALMLIAALLLGVQTTIIGSTRCVYEMSRDGLIIKQFGNINKFGVPVGSMYLDCAVTIGLLVIFKDNIVNLIASSNVGYMVVWILLPIAFILLRRQQPEAERPYKLPDFFVPVAVVIAAVQRLHLARGRAAARRDGDVDGDHHHAGRCAFLSVSAHGAG